MGGSRVGVMSSEGVAAHLLLPLSLAAWESLQVHLMVGWHVFSFSWEMLSGCPWGPLKYDWILDLLPTGWSGQIWRNSKLNLPTLAYRDGGLSTDHASGTAA